MSQTRRLAAILAADVAGYTRLIGMDEDGDLRAFSLFEPKIARRHGRLVKTTGHREPLAPKDRNVDSKAFAVARG
jgi:class 3 adenylate cyclase